MGLDTILMASSSALFHCRSCCVDLCCILHYRIRSCGWEVFYFTFKIYLVFYFLSLKLTYSSQSDYYFRFGRYMLLLLMLHQMALSLFRFMASIGRDMIIGNTAGAGVLMILFLLGGFIVPLGRLNRKLWNKRIKFSKC